MNFSGPNRWGERMKSRTIGLFFMKDRLRGIELARRIVSNAYEGYDLRFALGGGEFESDPEMIGLSTEKRGRLEEIELAVSIGGDGTFLRTARVVRDMRVPLYGINAGRLGFLALGHADSAEKDLSRILSGDYGILSRIPLKGSLLRGGKPFMELYALNEITITKGPCARPIELGVSVGDDRIYNFLADGVIVSTPTGSTAYALSTGGPIVHPDVKCVLIAPICPHSLYSRPVLLGGEATVFVDAKGEKGEIILAGDGQLHIGMEEGDRVQIALDVENKIDVVTLGMHSYYEILRDKLGWGKNNLGSWGTLG